MPASDVQAPLNRRLPPENAEKFEHAESIKPKALSKRLRLASLASASNACCDASRQPSSASPRKLGFMFNPWCVPDHSIGR